MGVLEFIQQKWEPRKYYYYYFWPSIFHVDFIKPMAAESHVVGGRGSGGEVNGYGSRSPGSSNFIPIYAANARHNRHRGAASSHKSHNVYLALFATMFFAYLCT
ncbi:hypothetical protein AABB24_038148 [Solanum stoloniferum]|uniref:Uncharacterized protein n=1 Tax=Solanum stoloniferum TaxID=62892 RepID=A0ABD2QWE6_9SOLN